ncbi:DUF3086 domain-containing protein [Synechococcus elongatus]|uniref:DUF3086 domain-containing protein n=1 Tax=Synechococcus elongatus TaxID=32046 RepID=UPI0030D24E92
MLPDDFSVLPPEPETPPVLLPELGRDPEAVAEPTPELFNPVEVTPREETPPSASTDDTPTAEDALQRLTAIALADLEARQAALLASIEKLEQRRDRIQQEIRSSFAGKSQEIAVRVQSFKDYLVGSLQDLAATAEQLDLVPPQPIAAPEVIAPPPAPPEQMVPLRPGFADPEFAPEAELIEQELNRYRQSPDYYGQPWVLRRTFEAVHEEPVRDWFFTAGGRGALRSFGSRQQNVLIASAVISVLNHLYGERLVPLILASTPERLGEWRRGLQDCLGLSREDFGPNQGITLFEFADALVQKAERIEERGDLPLIIIDDGEESVSLSLLQFPLWLAFAPDPRQPSYDLF